MTAELRLGDWREVLRDVECDSVITDPPYSDRTHEGQRSGNDIRVTGINYESMTRENIEELCESWHKRIRRWFVMFGDHNTWSWGESALKRMGLYTFQPVIWVKKDAAPRFSGDGPSSQVEHILVARTRWKPAPGELFFRPGFYIGLTASSRGITRPVTVGAKPLYLARALVRHYSLPGEKIADPFAGGATMLNAARAEGRSAVGAEVRPDTHEAASKLLDEGYTQELF